MLSTVDPYINPPVHHLLVLIGGPGFGSDHQTRFSDVRCELRDPGQDALHPPQSAFGVSAEDNPLKFLNFPGVIFSRCGHYSKPESEDSKCEIQKYSSRAGEVCGAHFIPRGTSDLSLLLR